MSDIFDDSKFGEESEMTGNTLDWGKPGDYILGTFIRARHNVATQYGENSIYEILAERGEFHKLVNKKPVDEVTKINKGETWAIWGRNDLFDGQMNTLRPGQIVKIRFAEEGTAKGGNNPPKIVKIAAPRDNEGKPLMNEAWLAEQDLV